MSLWKVLARGCLATGAGLALAIGPALAADAEPNSGDTAWVLTSSALVLFMTLPGLALFYGGLVRAKNFLSVLMHCFVMACVVSILWALVGYSLAFTPGNAWIGDMSRALLANMSAVRDATTLPESVFVMYQMTFAIITPALIIGAFPERVSFGFVILFTILWLMLVYVPAAHWVWGGGWLAARGVLDFAGGIVVHTTAGVSALVTVLLIGPRTGFPNTLMLPHSPGLAVAGAGMLWVGWFGFNGGSAIAANAAAGNAILATQLAASAAALVWIVAERLKSGKPTTIGIVTGAVAGLATVTPGAGYIGPIGGIITGLLAGLVCFFALGLIKQRLKIDDSLDVFAVHGVGGMLGTLLLAIFADESFGGGGLKDGIGAQLVNQIIGVVAVALWSAVATFVIVKIISFVCRLRASQDAEREGLDVSTHGERAYDVG